MDFEIWYMSTEPFAGMMTPEEYEEYCYELAYPDYDDPLMNIDVRTYDHEAQWEMWREDCLN